MKTKDSATKTAGEREKKGEIERVIDDRDDDRRDREVETGRGEEVEGR